MKTLLDCHIYYSMIGEHFNIYERNTDQNLWRSKALISMQINVPQLANHDDRFSVEELEDCQISMTIPHVVSGGPFFASETQCIIINGKNQILKLDGSYRLPIKMYRCLDNPSFFNILFQNREFKSAPQWISL